MQSVCPPPPQGTRQPDSVHRSGRGRVPATRCYGYWGSHSLQCLRVTQHYSCDVPQPLRDVKASFARDLFKTKPRPGQMLVGRPLSQRRTARWSTTFFFTSLLRNILHLATLSAATSSQQTTEFGQVDTNMRPPHRPRRETFPIS